MNTVGEQAPILFAATELMRILSRMDATLSLKLQETPSFASEQSNLLQIGLSPLCPQHEEAIDAHNYVDSLFRRYLPRHDANKTR